jgi:cysteinyl-tRNA synthetase
MSKSLGNFATIRDMLVDFHPEVLRLFVLQSHYRSPVDFSEGSLRDARTGMDRFYTTLKALKDALSGQAGTIDAGKEASLTEGHRQVLEKMMTLPERFTEAMDDDFNTARAIGHLYDAVRVLNSYMAEGQKNLAPEMVYVLGRSREILMTIGAVLGLFLADPDHYFDADRNREARKRGLNVEEIEGLIEARRLARAQKDWQRADEIRQLLVEKKVSLKDTPDRTVWKIE